MEKAWGGCYGGYMLPDSFGADGHELLFTFSLWNPYTTVLMKTQINSLSKETASKTTISAQSTVTTPTQAITHTISATTSQALQSGSGMISYYALVVVVIAAVIAAVAVTYQSRRRPASSQHKMTESNS
jgi:beta-lactamase regulating signal transducer with metallopeptidase domain